MDIMHRGGVFSKDKRGMSPLIATMLLIAFAVALGAMIINLGSGPGTEGGPDCSSVTMFISPYLCYAENMIKISVKNTGAPVESLTLKVVDESGETIKVLPDSKLASGDILQKEIPYIKTGKMYAGLYPSVLYKDKAVPCPEPAIEQGDVPSC